MEKIELYNRDRQKIWLERVGDGEWWQLRFDQPSLLNYNHFLFEDESSEIYAIDPPGGPYIMIGFKVEEKIVEEIKNTSMGIFLKLKP